jgi:antirestriction protein ArdC
MFLATAGFGSPYWCTPNQILKHKGRIRESETRRSEWILFWHPGYSKNIQLPGAVMHRSIPQFYRCYDVYNVEQTEGLERFIPTKQPQQFTPVQAAEQIIRKMPHPPKIKTNPMEAVYYLLADTISVPPAQSFGSPEEYYSTLLHELAHATGHGSRLNRPSLYCTDQWAGHRYSYEELVAEMSAAMLCGLAGIAPKTIANSAAYIASWLKFLQGNPNYVIAAGGAAQVACRYIRGKWNPPRASRDMA